MSNYNTQLQNNNSDLQEVLQLLQTKAAGGEQATPEITVNSTNGLITATAGTKSSTYQLAFQPAKTIIPSATSQVAVSANYYTGGNITVAAVPTQAKNVTPAREEKEVLPDEGKFLSMVNIAGDVNFVAENIKSGVSIFGVNGTLSVDEDSIMAKWFGGKIKNVENKVVSEIGQSIFTYIKIETASFPVCKIIGSYAFSNCSSLASVYFPECQDIRTGAFRKCSILSTMYFPLTSVIATGAFRDCYAITAINLPACSWIKETAFAYCYNLSSLVLGSSRVCSLSASNALISTPFAGYTASYGGPAYIYVPASLIDAYKSATNWTYFSNYFSTIESLNTNLITFTVGNTEYQAEEGMTWQELDESIYPASSSISIDNQIVGWWSSSGIKYTLLYNNNIVNANDTVISGAAYLFDYGVEEL